MADLFEEIHFEQQEGELCAQHALNSLLQGPYFTAVDLAELGRQIDSDEQKLHQQAQGGQHGNSSISSHNFDDSGFFSVQVISSALQVWNLELIPFKSSRAGLASNQPTRETAFICNLQSHWFTIRRFGSSPQRWYNLNSIFKQPEYLSETYLSLFLAQVQEEGYSIFVVRPQDEQSSFPQCQADQLALLSPVPSQSSILRAQQLKKSAAASQDQRGGGGGGGGSDDGMSEIAHRDSPAGTINGGDDEEDEQLKQALALSMQGVSNEHQGSGHGEEEEDVLQKVLQSSMEEDQEQALKRAMEESLRDYDEAHPDDEEMMSASWMSGGSSSSGAGNSSGGTRGGAVNLGIKGVSLEEEDADLNRAIEESIAAAAAASNNNASSTPASVSLNTTSSTAKRPPPTDSTAEMSIQDMRLARMARFSNSANGNADEGTVKRDKGKGKAVA